MKWLRENWAVLLIIVGIATMLIVNRIDIHNYKREIRVKSDSIAILKYRYSELEKYDTIASELLSAYEFAYTAYQDSLQDSRTEYTKQKIRYEKQVADLSRVPTDSLYVELRSWLDTIF